MDFVFSIKFLKMWVISSILFIVLDLLWLAVVANRLYFQQLGYLAKISKNKIVFNLPVGILVQIIIATGLLVFICLALQERNTLLTALGYGTFLGFVLYCTYDLTNLSFVDKWPVFISVVDIGWGSAQG